MAAPLILLLEDDPGVGLTISDVVETLTGGHVHHVRSSAEAVLHMQSTNVDLCILDIQLKRGTCGPALREARRRGLTIVITSGYPQHKYTDALDDIYAYLQKPVRMDQWRHILDQLFAERRRAQA